MESRFTACPGAWWLLCLGALVWFLATPTQAQPADRRLALVEALEAGREEGLADSTALEDELWLLLEEAPAPALELRGHLALSWLRARGGELDEALAHTERARELAGLVGDRKAQVKADYHMAVIAWYGARPEEALGWAAQARDAQRELRDQEALATTLTLMGAIYRSRSEYDEALAAHMEALAISEQRDDELATARSRNNIGLIYWRVGSLEEAKAELEAALPIYRSSGTELKMAGVLSNLGLLEIELERPDRALVWLEEAEALLEGKSSPRTHARVLSNMGFAQESMGNVGAAVEFYREALAIREGIQDHWGASRTLGSLADVSRRLGQSEEAVSLYEQGIHHAAQAEAKEEEAHLQEGLAECLELLGRYDEALVALRRHLALERDLERGETARKIAELEAQAALAHKDIEVRELEAERAHQDLRMTKQRNRSLLLLLGSLLLATIAAALFLVYRSHARSLAALARSHEELRRTTEQLQESEQRYRTVFDCARMPMLLLDEQGTVVDANGLAESFFEGSTEELLGARVAGLQPSWLQEASTKATTETRSRLHERVDEEGRSEWFDLRITPLRLGDRDYQVVSVLDVTELQRQEEERARIEKLESLGLLAGGIAHDFNNALTAVLGSISLVRSKPDLEASSEQLLGEAMAAVEQATRLTGQLLAFSSGGTPQRQPRDLRLLLRETVEFCLSGTAVRVEYDFAPNLWAAEVDEGQFRQVVSNLVLNGAQAMGEGGLLVIRAINVESADPLGPREESGSFVRIDVQDSGPGIAREHQGKVLDPYYTTKEDGSGLGLPTAFAIANRHGGWLEFETEVGLGTTFTLHLPATQRKPEVKRGPSQVASESVKSGSILVMDDDTLVQNFYRAALRNLGFDYEIVRDGESAVRAWLEAAEVGRPFDLVIMDLTVSGGMGGQAAMAKILQVDPSAKGVVASGYNRNAVMSDYRRAGFAGALGKPFSLPELDALLREVLPQKVATENGGGL